MVVFPNAKINLGLHILVKRPDGYHELETCFYPVQWKEALEIIESDKTVVTTSGIVIPDHGDNIIFKAYQLLQAQYDLPPVKIHLHKVIPIGAGLGGGSADAAFTLMLLNNYFSLGLDDEQLITFAIQLGADCAFFIKNKPMLATGIGEKLSEANITLAGKFIQLVYPNIHISTKEAFANITPGAPSMRIRDIFEKNSLLDWKDVLSNDFEKPLFKKYPVLNEIKKQLYESGAIYAAMSGSGSSMFGIFDHEPEVHFPEDFKLWSGQL